LWKLCHEISKKVGGFECHTRNEHKKGIRILSKAIQKYSDEIHVNVSRVVDSYGCEIVSKDKKGHEEVLKNIFRMFGKPHKIVVNNRTWEVQIQKIKLDLSNDSDLHRTRFAYQDDKIIFGARMIKEAPAVEANVRSHRKLAEGEDTDPEQKPGDYLCLEAITFPKNIKSRKHDSHLLYSVVREAGEIVIGKLALYGAEHMCNVFSKQAKSSEEKTDVPHPMALSLTRNASADPQSHYVTPQPLARSHSVNTPHKNDVSKTLWDGSIIDGKIAKEWGRRTTERLNNAIGKLAREAAEARDRVEGVHEVKRAHQQKFFTKGSTVRVVGKQHFSLKDLGLTLNETLIVHSSDGRTDTVKVKRESDMRVILERPVPKDILEIIKEAPTSVQASGVRRRRKVD